MKKNLLFLIALLFATLGAWAQVPGNPVTTASGVTVCSGITTVDIPITVNDFNAVGSISLKFAYVNTQITSPSVVYKDPGLTAWGNFMAETGTAGTIIISAYDPNVTIPITGLSLTNGTTLFTLQFTILSGTTSSALTFVENAQGTSCEYGGVGPYFNPFTDTPKELYYIPGGVTVVPDPSWTAYTFPTTSICNGGSVTFSAGINNGLGGTVSWIRSDNPTPGSGTEVTVTSPDTPGTGTWYYRPHYAPTGIGCDLADGTQTTVTVVADPSWTAYTFPTTSICNGGSVTFSAGISGGLGGTVSWIRSDSPTPGAGTEVTVTSPDSPGIDTWYYRPHYTPTVAGCDLVDGAQTTVTVVADPSWTAYTFPTTSICNGGSVTFSVGINDGLGGIVRWIRSTVPGGSGTTVTSPDFPGIGTWYYRPHFVPTGTGCDLADGIQTIVTVIADPSWTAYSFPTTSICNGGSVTFSAGISGGLGGTVSWIRSDNAVPGAGTEVTVTSPNSPGIGTWYYRPRYTPTVTGCDLADGTQTTVNVVADPTWAAYSFPTTSICNGGSVTFGAGISGGLGGPVTWIRSDNAVPGAGTEVTVTSPDSPGTGTWYYRPHYSPIGVGCDLVDGTQTTVTVYSDPSWTAYDFPTTSICNGGSVTFSVSISSGLGGTITWIRSATAGGSGTTVTSPDAPGIGTWYYRPQYAPTGEGCNLADGTETTVTVTADPSWTGYSFPTTSICNGGSVSFSVSTSGGLGGTISWIRSATTGGSGTTVTSPDDPGIGTWYYRPHYAPTGVGCDLADGTETTVTVVADPLWTGYSFPTTSICNGGSVSFDVNISGGLGGTISWIRSTSAGGSGTSVTSPDNPGVGTWYYHPHYAPTGVGCDLADGTETTVTVVADPLWTGYSFPTTSICNGGSVSFDVNISGGLGGTISWIRSTSAGGSGTTVTSPDNPGVGTWYYHPHYAPTGVGCDLADGTETTVTVVADPSWTAYDFPTTSICNGGTVTFNAEINDGLGGIVSWIRSDNPTPGGGTEITVTSPDSPVTGTWYYRPHYAPAGVGCDLADGTQTTVNVAADPSWTAYDFPITSICNGGSVSFSVSTSGGLGGIVSWIRSDNPAPGSGTEITVTSPDFPGIGNWYYRPHYAPSGVGCNLADGSQTSVAVVTDPLWASYSFPTTSICNGGSVTFSVGISGGLGGTVSWIRSDNPAPGIGTEVAVTSPNSPGTGTWYYRPHYTPTDVGCDLGDGTQTTVNVSPDPSWTGYSFPITSICNGGSVSFSVSNSGGLGGTVSWIRSASAGGIGTVVTSPDAPGIGTWYYRPQYAPSGEGCNLADGTETTVTVVPDPLWTSYSFSATTICNGSSIIFSVAVSDGLGGTISWIRSATSGGSGTVVTSPDIPDAGTWYYRPQYAPTGEGCNLSDGTETTVIVNERKKISGNFYYHNIANTPLTELIHVELYLSSDAAHTTLIDETDIDGTGHYEFPNLCPACIYDIVATSTHTTEGSVNTTDAAQVNFWPTTLYSIQKVRFFAGDVAGPNNFLGGIDAGRIQEHFVSGTAFDRLPWTFWRTGETTTVNSSGESYPGVSLLVGSDATADMFGLCTGDFNHSFDPTVTKSSSATLDLIYTGNRQVSNNQEFDLPLRMVNASAVGAVSLILNFPADLVEIQDVLMTGAGGMLDWAVKGNELRIGWNSPVPVSLAAEAELVTLRMRTSASFTVGNSIRITLAANPLNELADAMYDVIGNAVLSVDVIDATAVGINEQPAEKRLALSCHPNPFSDFTTISYTVPFEGKVVVEICNILGNKVTTLVSATQSVGNHWVKFDTFGLPPGIYTATLKLNSANDQLIRTIKLINNK